MKSQDGYTLFELLLIIVVLSILLVTASINIGPILVSFDIDDVAAKVSASLSRARREALRGDRNSPNYNPTTSNYGFDTNAALPSQHPGIVVSTTAPTGSNTACQGQPQCAGQPLSICVSGEQFCYTSATKFEFLANSGRLPNSYAIFLISKSRQLAILISRDGKTDLAELTNGQWRSRTDLQQLHQ